MNFLFYKRRASKAQLGRMIESGRRSSARSLRSLSPDPAPPLRSRYEDTVNFLFYKRRANKAQLGRMIESGRRSAPAAWNCLHVLSRRLGLSG